MTSTHTLIRYFQNIVSLSEEESKAIADSMEVRKYSKGTVLLKEGQISRECYFVLKGCVRSYILHEGTEKIDNFFIEEDWIVALDSFLYQKPSLHYIVCCEDTELVVGTASKEQDLYEAHPRFESIARKIMEQSFAQMQTDMRKFYMETPEMRYKKLIRERPSLIQRVPQYQIASYIGVQPETLSRMRARMARNRTL